MHLAGSTKQNSRASWPLNVFRRLGKWESVSPPAGMGGEWGENVPKDRAIAEKALFLYPSSWNSLPAWMEWADVRGKDSSLG